MTALIRPGGLVGHLLLSRRVEEPIRSGRLAKVRIKSGISCELPGKVPHEQKRRRWTWEINRCHPFCRGCPQFTVVCITFLMKSCDEAFQVARYSIRMRLVQRTKECGSTIDIGITVAENSEKYLVWGTTREAASLLLQRFVVPVR